MEMHQMGMHRPPTFSQHHLDLCMWSCLSLNCIFYISS